MSSHGSHALPKASPKAMEEGEKVHGRLLGHRVRF